MAWLLSIERLQVRKIALRQATARTWGARYDDAKAWRGTVHESSLSAPHPLGNAFLIQAMSKRLSVSSATARGGLVVLL